MIYLFDLDNTLIDTEKNKEHIYNIAIQHGYDREVSKEIYKKARFDGQQNTISLERYLQVLQEYLIRDGKTHLPNIATEVAQAMKTDPELLLPGAEEFLKDCQVKKIRMILLSLGVPVWQEEKIQWSGLDKYFSKEKGEVVLTQLEGEGKIEAIKMLFGENFDGADVNLFNDKPDETRELLKVFPKMRACVRQEIADARYGEADFVDLQRDFADRIVIFREWNSLVI